MRPGAPILAALLLLCGAASGAGENNDAELYSKASEDALPAEPEELSPTAAEAPTLPVVCYHRFNADETKADHLSVPPKRFAEQLRWLRRRGYESLSLDQARRFMAGDLEGLPPKPVMLTVDDGYKNGLTVGAPILKRYGYKAVYFVNSLQVGGSSNFLNWKDLQALMAAGHEVASHTGGHSNLARPKLDEDPAAYRARLSRELLDSRVVLERRLGITVTALAYPYGAFNPWVAAAAKEAGYDLAFSVSGGVNVPGDDAMAVRRILLMMPLKDGSFARRVRERRLLAEIQGLREGMGLHPHELPREISLKLPKGWKEGDELRAIIEGGPMKLRKENGGWVATVRKEIKPGFYFFRVEAGFDRELGRDAYLFQVFRKGLEAYFPPLTPTATTTADTGAKP